MKTFLSSLSLAFLLLSRAAFADDFFLKGGETIVFIGDSITQAGDYVEYIEAYLATQHQDKSFKVVYAGLSSETISGTSEPDHVPRRPYAHDRFARDVVPHDPGVVVACYGMNDGNYHPFEPERFAKFQAGVRRLEERVRKETKARLVLVTPPPFDPYRRQVGDPNAIHFGYKFPAADYDETLRRYSEWLVSLRAEGFVVADVHTVLNEHLRKRRESKASFFLAGDAVHPGPLGHWLMAQAILEAWNAPLPEGAAPELRLEGKTMAGVTADYLGRDKGILAYTEFPPSQRGLEVLELIRRKRKEPAKAAEISARLQELCRPPASGASGASGAIRETAQAAGVSSMLGVNIHFTGAPARDLDLIRDAGFGWVRMDFGWQAIERQKGAYHFDEYDALLDGLSARGLRALFILDYSNGLYEESQSVLTPAGREAFARFAAASAARYKGRGVRWEIWNEPNLGQFWKPEPSPDDYAALVIEAGKAIRAADPHAVILAPASSGFPWPFLERIFEKGILEHAGEVSVHPYRGTRPETVREDYARLRGLIEKRTPAGRKPPPIVSGEWGYSAVHYGGVPLGEELQAAYLSRSFLTNLSEGISLSIWYDWANDGTNPKETEQNFGTVTADRQPKPAYAAVKMLTSALGEARFVRRLEGAPEDHFLLFNHATRSVLAAWTEGSAHAVAIQWTDGSRDLRLDGRPQYAEVPTDGKTIAVYGVFTDLLSERLRVHVLRGGPGKEAGALTVEIGTGELRTKVGLQVALDSKGEAHEFPVTWPADSPLRVDAVLRDSSDRHLLASLPALSYAAVNAFYIGSPAEELLKRFSVVMDGDAKVDGEAALFAGEWQDRSRKAEKTLILEYRFGKGHKFVRVEPAKGLAAIPGKPSALSVWVKGDGLGHTLRCRFKDSKGETFQPTAGPVSWRGWRQVTLALDGREAKPWGGNDDGRVDYPIAWDSIFLVDSSREECSGSIEFASPLLVYPAE